MIVGSQTKGRKTVSPLHQTHPDRGTPEDLLDDLMLVYQNRRELPDVIVLVLRPKGNVQIADAIDVKSRSGLTKLHA